MKRKFLSLLLALCMVLSLMPATVFAAGTTSVTVGGVKVSSTGEGDIFLCHHRYFRHSDNRRRNQRKLQHQI